MFVDHNIKKLTKTSNKFEQLAPDIKLKDEIIDIKAITNSGRDYLIYVTNEK